MSLQGGRLYAFGKFRLDTVSRRLFCDNRIVTLTPKVFDLLVALVKSEGQIVSKEELLSALWPDTFVEEGNLTQNISVLRKALGAGANGEDHIETVPRQGYRFVTPVNESESPSEEISISDVAPERVVVHKKASTFRWRLGVLCGVLVVVLGAAAAWFRVRDTKPTTPQPSIDSVVVLPFVNLSPDKENEYFSDGLTEELINTLTAIDGLRVVARTTAFQFKGKAQDIRTVGRQLGVAAVLEGSVRKEQTRLRVTAQLNSVNTGYHLWSESYDRELKDVFAIQKDIAKAIQERVQQKAGPGDVRLAKQWTPNLEAYNLYLQGRYHQARLVGKSMDRAIAAFEQAIEKEPNYAAAYAGLAFCYTELGYSGQLVPQKAFPKAVVPLKQALSLDDSLAEAHALQGIVSLLFDWDWDRARAEFDRAISLNPASSLAHHWYSHYLVAMGRLQESLLEAKRALELDPLDPGITSHQAWSYDYARAYDQAREAAERSLEIDPNHVPSLVYLQWSYEGAGQFDKAISVLEKLGTTPEDGRVLRGAMRTSGAHGYWRARLELAKRSPMTDGFRIAELYGRLNDADEAVKSLERAFQERHSWLIYLNSDPAFDGVRGDPRFKALVKKVGLPTGRRR